MTFYLADLEFSVQCSANQRNFFQGSDQDGAKLASTEGPKEAICDPPDVNDEPTVSKVIKSVSL